MSSQSSLFLSLFNVFIKDFYIYFIIQYLKCTKSMTVVDIFQIDLYFYHKILFWNLLKTVF
jgi:hypothetical protein